MKITKNEQAAIQTILDPFQGELINTKLFTNTLVKINNYSGMKPSSTAQKIKEVQDTIPESSNHENELTTRLSHENELLTRLSYHQAKLNTIKRANQLTEAPDSLIFIALVKTGIRIGYQPDTYLLLDNVSVPRDNKLSDKVIAQLLLGD